jgi:hypothetical protein
MNYAYETIVKDACYPAIEGHCHLATGIDELKNDFSGLFGTDLTFEDALVLFNKTEEQYVNDVVKLFIKTRREMRKNEE